VAGTFFRPLSSERRDVTYFDFGYNESGSSIDGTVYANGHWDSIANGGPTGFTYITNTFGDSFPDQPLRGTSARSLASVRDSWLEEALRLAQLLQYGSLVSGPAPASAAQLVAGSTAHSQVLSSAQQAYLAKTKALREEIKDELDLEDLADRMKFFDAYSQHVLGRTN